jgi:hypothetical protein
MLPGLCEWLVTLLLSAHCWRVLPAKWSSLAAAGESSPPQRLRGAAALGIMAGNKSLAMREGGVGRCHYS